MERVSGGADAACLDRLTLARGGCGTHLAPQ